MPTEILPKSIINLWTLILYNKVTIFQMQKILVLQNWISSLACPSAIDPQLIMFRSQRIHWSYVITNLFHLTIGMDHRVHECNKKYIFEEFLWESTGNVEVHLSPILLGKKVRIKKYSYPFVSQKTFDSKESLFPIRLQ